MIKRQILQELKTISQQYRVITMTGPRQAGKTTLTRLAFPTYTYVSLEDPDIRALASSDPRAFLKLYPSPVIFDEIQRTPKLLSYIQTIVDVNPAPAQYILTGSHQLELNQAITQSLAGRTALLTLYPLSIAELSDAEILKSADEYLYQGFLPAVHSQQLDPIRYYRNYFQTYVERDIRQMIQLKDFALFETFMRLCAGRMGQLLNAHSLANEVGVSSHTINHWLSILEASFVIYRLQPFHENLGKRLVKTPKLYFTDVGLASYLLGIETIEQLQRDPLRGQLFENLVVIELLKFRSNQGLDPHIFFYRDSNQNEVDILFQVARHYVPIEIKSASTFHPSFTKSIEYLSKIDSQKFVKGAVIYAGELEPELQHASVINFRKTKALIESLS